MARNRRLCAVRSEFLEVRLYLSRAGLLDTDRVPGVDVDQDGIAKRGGDAEDSILKGQAGDNRGRGAIAAAGDEPARGTDADAAPTPPITDESVTGEPVAGEPVTGEPDQDAVADSEVARDSAGKDKAGFDADIITDSDVDAKTDVTDADVEVVVDRDRRDRADVTRDVVTETDPVDAAPIQPALVDEPGDTAGREPRDNVNVDTRTAAPMDDAAVLDTDPQVVATRPAASSVDETTVADAGPADPARDRTAVREVPAADSDTAMPDEIAAPDDSDAPQVVVRIDTIPFTPETPANAPVNTDGGTVDDRPVTVTDPRTDVTTPAVSEGEATDDVSTPADRDLQPRPVPDAADETSDADEVTDGDDASDETEQPSAPDTDVPVGAAEDESAGADKRRDPQLTPVPPVTTEIVEDTGHAATHPPRSVWRPESLKYGPTWRPTSDQSSLDMTLWMSQHELADSSLTFALDDEDYNAAVSDAAMLGILLVVLNRTRRRSVSDSIFAGSGAFEPFPDSSSAGTLRRRKRASGSGRLPSRGGTFRTRFDIPDPEFPGGASHGSATFACDAAFADGATMALLYRRNFEAPRDSAESRSLSAMVSSILAGGALALQRLARGMRSLRNGASRGGSSLRRPAMPRYSGPTV